MAKQRQTAPEKGSRSSWAMTRVFPGSSSHSRITSRAVARSAESS